MARTLAIWLLAFLLPAVAWADSVPSDWCTAQQRQYVNEACQYHPVGSVWDDGHNNYYGCRWGTFNGNNAIYSAVRTGGPPQDSDYILAAQLSCPPADTAGAQCKTRSPFLSTFNGNATDGLCDAGCGFVPDPSAGITITRNAYGQVLAATWKPTGATCDGSGGGATNPTPPPSSPDKFLPNVPTLSNLCGGASCHDSSTDSFCGVSGGVQTCVPGTTARGPGGCISNGEQTVCAGSPAPLPAPPPASPISDPAKEIKGSDDYLSQKISGSTVTNTTITTNVYTSGSTPSSSGQQAGDRGPAPASSSPSRGDGTTAFGGGDCNTPPVVNGSGGLNAIALQTWKTRCAIEGSKLGTGTVGSLGNLYTPTGDTTASAVADFKANIQQAPLSAAVSGFFSVGSVGGSCPVWTLPESQWNPPMTFDFYCRPELSDILDGAKVVVLIACAYMAWRVAMGDA